MKDKCLAEVLIFDLDGTLVDTRHDLTNAVNEALQKIGKEPLAVEVVTRYVGDGINKLLERALGSATTEEFDKARQHFRRYYAEHLADFSQLYPGVCEVLEYFHHKKKAVLTNKPQDFTEALLQRLGIHHHFEIIVGGQPNLKLKPDPEAVLTILRRFGLTPDRSIIIGDGENDILTGKAAGIYTCAVTYGFRPAAKLLALQPDFIVRNLRDLKYLIV